MEVEINLLGVLLAGVAAMVVGSIWYSRRVFGAPWVRLAKVDEKAQQQIGWAPMVYMFVLALVMAYVLAHIAYQSQAFFGVSYMFAAVSTAFWAWLGFVVPTLVGTGLFEMRRKKLMAINAGNWLVTLLVQGWILGLVGV